MTTCTLTGKYTDTAGNALTGTVTFTPSAPVVLVASSGKVVISKPIVVTLSGSGSFTVTVPATDDPANNPINWTYTVSENAGGAGRVFSISAAGGATIDMSTVGPVPSSSGTSTGTGGGDGSAVANQALAATVVNAAAIVAETNRATAAETANTNAIATKASQTALNTTNANVSANATAIAGKADATATTNALATKADLVGGVIPTSQIPSLALTTSVVVANQAAMLALTSAQVQPGDLAVRGDGAGTFILTASDPSVLANWRLLNAPTDAVSTVNGQTGTVVLAAADVGAATPASVTSAVATETTRATTAEGNNAAAILLRAIDLADVTVNAAGALTANVNSNVTVTGTFTAPAPTGTLGTPPQRFAITNQSGSTVTLQFPNPSGTTVKLTVLAGEVVTMRQKSTSGYANESGNKPLAQLDARYNASALSNYVAGQSLVDQFAYVPRGWGSNYRTARAAALAGTGQCRIAVTGDSIWQGYYSSNLDTMSPAGQLASALQTLYGDGGSGFRGASQSSVVATAKSVAAAAITAYNSAGCYATLAGTWASANGAYGPGFNNALSTTDIATPAMFTRVVRGTTVKVFTVSNGGSNAAYQYRIDGGSWISIADGSGANIQTTTVTGLSTGNHTVDVRYNDATKTLFLCGVAGENASGVIVNNHSVYGATSNSVSTAAFGDTSIGADWLGGWKYPADLAIWALSANDGPGSIAGDVHLKNLRRWAAQMADGNTRQGTCDMLVVMPHIGKFDNTNYLFQDYTSRARAFCEAAGIAFVSFWALGRMSWNYWQGLGYMANSSSPGAAGSDSIHNSDAGHTFTKNTLLPLFTA